MWKPELAEMVTQRELSRMQRRQSMRKSGCVLLGVVAACSMALISRSAVAVTRRDVHANTHAHCFTLAQSKRETRASKSRARETELWSCEREGEGRLDGLGETGHGSEV